MTTQVSGLSFSYGNRLVLNDISFSIQPSQLLSIIGPNGVGKSTLFRCILGLMKNYQGKILINNQAIMQAVGDENKVKLLYLSGEDGLNVIAKGSFHAEILDMVSDNAAIIENPSSKGTGNPVDMEQIVLWNPDVILFAPGSAYSTVGSDPAWQKLDAIKSGHYYEVPEGPFNWMGFPPSVNRYMGMIWVTQLLYPEQAQYNVYDETAKYYDLFYHSQLTEDQYKELVANSLLKQ